MKIAIITSAFGLVMGQTTDINKKFKHLNKVYPQMLDLFFKSPGAFHQKGADRVADRFKDNFAKKHAQLESFWSDCPQADLAVSLMRVDDNVRFDKAFAKKAIHQITNGYKQVLDALVGSDCPKVTRYTRMSDRFTMIADMLKFHYCDKVDQEADWCKKHRSNPRRI